MVTWKTAQKCLWFAEGKKGKTLFNGVKTPDFPESLLKGEHQKDGDTAAAVAALLEGEAVLSMRQIGERLGITPQAVYLQVNRLKGKRQFYAEWLDFESTLKATGVAHRPLAEVLVSDKDKKAVERLESQGVTTVIDYLHAAVTRSKRDFYQLANAQQASVERHFSEIAEVIKPILTAPAYEIERWKEGACNEVEGQLNLYDIDPRNPSSP